MIVFRTIILAFLVLMVTVVEAGVYKWVDEQGRVHYGDKPTSENAGEVNIKDQPISGQSGEAASRQEKQQRFLRAREEERKEKQQARAEEKRKKAMARRNCEQAKKDYDKYTHAGGLYVKDKSGQREYLSFKEREEYEKSLAAKIKKWCPR